MTDFREISSAERIIIVGLCEAAEEAIRSELMKLSGSLHAVGQDIVSVEVGGPPNFSVIITHY